MVKSDVSSRASSASAINPSPVLFLDEAALIFHPRFLRNADGAASWNRDQPTVSVECLPRQVARVRPCKKYRHTRGLDRLPYETQRNGALERLARFVGRYFLTVGIGGDDRIEHEIGIASGREGGGQEVRMWVVRVAVKQKKT